MRSPQLLAALCCAMLVAVPAAAAGPNLTPAIEVTGGSVVGLRQSGLDVFKGIPFAAPPVRELRWRAPAPVVPWRGVRIADRYSAMCMQPLRVKNSVFYMGEEPTSEDCLYLNVWSPRASAGKKLPVMVFVFGGGWTIGSGSMPLYSGEGLARKGVVVVTFNYRVGSLGFFAHPELTAESKTGASGNYGLMDFISALGWVQANAAKFGGDPGKVTVFGQSAGAAAISLLDASPLAKGLFQQAIGQSGGFGLLGKIQTLADAEQQGVSVGEKLKATSLQALRDRGADAILAAMPTAVPILDGHVLPKAPEDVYKAGAQLHVPTLVGSNADESTAYPVVMTSAAFTEDARKRYGERADALLALYPAANEEEARASSYALHRDRLFASAVRTWARWQSKVSPVFVYHWDHHQPFAAGTAYSQQDPATKLGAYHGSEMAYAYANLDLLNWNGTSRIWTSEDRALSKMMSDYWVNFARTGNPNGAGLPVWPAYDAAQEKVMIFTDAARPGDLPNKARLDFLSSDQKPPSR